MKLAARALQLVVDLAVLAGAYCLAFLFRYEFALTPHGLKLLFFTLPYVLLLQYVALVAAGVTVRAWRYVALKDVTRILIAVAGAAVILLALRLGLASVGGHARFIRIPLGVLGMNTVLALLGITGIRVLRRVAAERAERQRIVGAARPKRTLLVGAGRAGSLVANELARRPDVPMQLLGFVDDDPVKIGTLIQGVKVLGDTHSLARLIEEHRVELVVISMAAVPREVVRRITDVCVAANIPTQIVPGVYEILDGRVNLSRIREVTIDDLLGRPTVELDDGMLDQLLRGRRVLVTGAGGSIGSEICRQVSRFQPESLVLVERAENALFDIHRELTRDWPDGDAVPVICDVCEIERVESVFAQHTPDIVFHAAAHKHVPMMEWNPGEAVKNNVFGTKVVADAAHRCGVGTFVLISSDKAVNPTSVMGATKRAAEVYLQSLSRESSTTYVTVRFGNVLGSAGSVIPIFKQQIEGGGPVTVTHPEMVRYFMTIPEASRLVIQAAAMGKGGEIFILDMGDPVNITDLARDLIRLSGLTEAEIPIVFTGVRPGEKLREELAVDSEKMDRTRHPKIFVGNIQAISGDTVLTGLESLRRAAESCSGGDVRAALRLLVPEMIDGSAESASPKLSAAPDRSRPTLH